MTRPDRRTLDAANTLTHLAGNVTDALQHLERERHICDGYPSRGDSAGRGTASSSTTEAAAIGATGAGGRLAFDRKAEDIRDTITTIEAAVTRLAHLTTHAIGMRAPIDVPRCRDNQMGRQGALEWGDATCEALPDKAGLCVACYHRERRWRTPRGLIAREIEPAA